ncbi:MAG: hypothetical protein SFY80_03695 [Verrucomicrobiota bacterium]|nr:hypothetical protein [Verrucomicrobiota bacterium]
MNTKGESPKSLKSRYGSVAGGNCVAARLGGEQPEAKLQAQMTNELDAAYCDGEVADVKNRFNTLRGVVKDAGNRKITQEKCQMVMDKDETASAEDEMVSGIGFLTCEEYQMVVLSG